MAFDKCRSDHCGCGDRKCCHHLVLPQVLYETLNHGDFYGARTTEQYSPYQAVPGYFYNCGTGVPYETPVGELLKGICREYLFLDPACRQSLTHTLSSGESAHTPTPGAYTPSAALALRGGRTYGGIPPRSTAPARRKGKQSKR